MAVAGDGRAAAPGGCLKSKRGVRLAVTGRQCTSCRQATRTPASPSSTPWLQCLRAAGGSPRAAWPPALRRSREAPRSPAERAYLCSCHAWRRRFSLLLQSLSACAAGFTMAVQGRCASKRDITLFLLPCKRDILCWLHLARPGRVHPPCVERGRLPRPHAPPPAPTLLPRQRRPHLP